jgi:hypothetical protein
MSQQQSPEIMGLLAANSGFGLLEPAFLPVPRLIRSASLWFLAAFSLGAVSVASGITVIDDVSPIAGSNGVSPIAVGEPASSADALSLGAVSSTAEEIRPSLNLPVQTVVLRGQPPSKVGRHL